MLFSRDISTTETTAQEARPLARLAIILSFFSLTAAAQEIPWYTVEVLVFERTNPGALEAEHWRRDPGFPDLEGALKLTRQGGPADEPHAYTLLGRDEFMLKEIASRLGRSKSLKPILHLAWRQRGLDRAESQPVHIRSAPYLRTTQTAEPQRRGWGSQAGQAPRWTGGGAEGLQGAVTLEGTLRLYRSRYLHVDLDLRYFRRSTGDEPPPALEQDAQTMATAPGTLGEQDTMVLTDEDQLLHALVYTHFRLTEHRRLRSRETHYFDHPLFGALVQVTPYELPAPKPAPAARTTPEGQSGAVLGHDAEKTP